MTRDKSNKTTVIVSVVIALILSTLAVEAEKDVSEECKKLGFDTKNLLCQDCDLFFEVTKDNELKKECKKCCSEQQIKQKYHAASISACRCNIKSFPEILHFFEKRSQAFGSKFTYQYVNGIMPTLFLKDERLAIKEQLRIDNWTSDDIEDFLQENLL